MNLRAQWDDLLTRDWNAARIRVAFEESTRIDRAAQLLGPLQPMRTAENELTFQARRSDNVRRLLARLDAERIHGALELLSAEQATAAAPEIPARTLRESWAAEVATIPSDWSDLLVEIEFTSSDYVEKGALNMVPLNPRRDGARNALRFRAARSFGYGASTQMVERCLSRCDEDGMRGAVQVLRVISGSRPVGTQGPSWQIDGLTV